jgi:hypothetical protein
MSVKELGCLMGEGALEVAGRTSTPMLVNYITELALFIASPMEVDI